MGGAVSSGRNNCELVDNLCYENYIQTPEVEMVFRKIDRAFFMKFTEEQDMSEAYEDHAWRCGKLHLSAPCIYTKAMEALKLDQGVSFLNIGSGTGYLSTMAGLLIGPFGVNHGVEIYPENIEFAQEKQDVFKEKSPWYDPVDYCEPFFVAGNGLLVSPGNMLYDRIYCGAACPPEHAQLMKNMLSVGGRLVMPHGNQLEHVERVSQTEWKTEVVLPSVSFAPLILPSEESVKDLDPLQIDLEPLPLKQYCRLKVLNHLKRKRYGDIQQLPLPQHLKDYVSYYKKWGPPRRDPQILCPIDHTNERSSEEDEEDEEDENSDVAEGGAPLPRRRHRQQPGRRVGGGNGPSARQVNIDGKRMLICNVNGVYFQIPMDTDEEDGGEDGDEDREREVGENSSDTYGDSDDNNNSSDSNQEDMDVVEEREEQGATGLGSPLHLRLASGREYPGNGEAARLVMGLKSPSPGVEEKNCRKRDSLEGECCSDAFLEPGGGDGCLTAHEPTRKKRPHS